MTKTSLSGRLNWMIGSQGRPSSSSQCEPSNFTMRPTCGAGMPSKFVPGGGSGIPANSVTTAVRLPVVNPAA